MSDLIFAVRTKESRKNGFLVVESFLCKNKYNKYAQYRGGFLGSVDVFAIGEANNISKEKLTIIVNIIKKNAVQIYKNGYMFLADSFKEFCHIIVEEDFFYFSDAPDAMTLIKKVEKVEEFPKVGKHAEISSNDAEFIYMYKNYTLYYKMKSIEGSKLVTDFTPTVQMIYAGNNNRRFLLSYIYNNCIEQYNSKVQVIIDEGMVIPRNYRFENTVFKMLLQIGFKKIAPSEIEYQGVEDISNVVSDLRSRGYMILESNSLNKDKTERAKIVLKPSANGWLDIGLSYELGGNVFELASLIDLSSEKKIMSLHNMAVRLPDSIIENRDKIIYENGSLKINQRDLWSVLHILGESENTEWDFINYSQIEIDIDKKLYNIAKPFQIEGIKWLKWLYMNQMGGCLADDMGLGKTFQIIAMLSDKDISSNLEKVLIIVPKSLLTNWRREFTKFSGKQSVYIYHGTDRNDKDLNYYQIILTTYQTAKNDIDILKLLKFSLIVFDEIQLIKNDANITTIELKKLQSKVRIGLSGTPMENNIEELWNILDIINPNMMTDKLKFCKRYKNKAHLEELHKLLRPFILRRNKEEVLSELPKRMEEIVYCDFEENQKKLYQSIVVSIKEAMATSRIFNSAIMLKGLLFLRECCCHTELLSDKVNRNKISESCKLDALRILVHNLYENNHKVLIFSQFTKMLKLIKSNIGISDNDIYFLDGKTNKRQELVDSFERAQKGVFLISLKAGGVGLNLVSAQDVIIFDPWWNPFAEEQAIDRAYRIGQKNNVSVYKFIVSDTIEEKILDLQDEKKDTFENIIEGIDNKENNVDLKQLLNLL